MNVTTDHDKGQGLSEIDMCAYRCHCGARINRHQYEGQGGCDECYEQWLASHDGDPPFNERGW